MRPENQTQIKISLLKAACISILMYGCQTWILTETLIEKLDTYATTCYRIILGIKQSRDHMTNQSLYQLTGQVSLRETIRERQPKFTGHCDPHAKRRTRQPICHL